MLHRFQFAMFVLLFLLLGHSDFAQAQPTDPVVPMNVECAAVPQRSLVVLFATPVVDSTPSSVLEAPQASGTATAQDTEALTAVTRAVLACLNTGDYWSLITFVSDAYLQRSFVDGLPSDPLALQLEPFVNAVRGCERCEIAPRTGNQRLAIVTIGDALTLPNGRIGLDLTLANADGSQAFSLLVSFISIGDQWLVDQIFESEGEATPGP